MGFDLRNDGPYLGAQLRLPLPLPGPLARIAALPGGEVTFLGGVVEPQVNGDVSVDVTTTGGALYVGGGFAYRNTVPLGAAAGAEREWFPGYSLFLGVRAPPGRESFAFQLELRRSAFAVEDEALDDYTPVVLVVGLSWPLHVLP